MISIGNPASSGLLVRTVLTALLVTTALSLLPANRAEAELPSFAQAALEGYLKASNTGADDRFGWSVALSGDTLAVGARFESSNATGVGVGTVGQDNNLAPDSGAVYVFTRNPATGVWSQQAYLKASNTGANDELGSSVALDGDTLAVGAVRERSNAIGINGNQADDSLRDSGAVYVFTRTGGVWSQQAYVKASNTEADDQFGWSVALAADTLAVGARDEDSIATGVNGDQISNSAIRSGAVYVFTRTGGVWSQQAYVKASNTGEDDHFGWGVALSGNTLAVGAINESSGATGVNGDQTNNGATFSGAAYVFTRTGGVWSQQAYVKASNTARFSQFGATVALSGDTLAVGAPSESSNAIGVGGNQGDSSAGDSGAAYVFTRTGGVWSQQAYVKASNTETGDQFGVNVTLSGDSLAVGAYGEDSAATGVNGNQADNSASTSGAAYVFTRTGGVWSQQAYVKASNPGVQDQFGLRVALSGDSLAVGAPFEGSAATGVGGDQANDNAPLSGAVYVYRAPTTDTDGDGIPNSADNCTLVTNPTQLDANSDGYGNICDADLNNSGLVTTADFGLLRSVLNQSAGSSATAAAADLNGSGTVTTADFAILRARLNTAPGPSGLHP